MKGFLNTSILIVICLGSVSISNSCKKEEVPTLITSEVTNITGTTATSGGTITSGDLMKIVERGICWSKNKTPTIGDDRIIELGRSAIFVSNMLDLDAATTYYVRAYATNKAGTGYGMAVSFTTLGKAPTATTGIATNIDTASAILNGTANPNWVGTVVVFEYGTTTNYGQSVDTGYGPPIIGNVLTNINGELQGLTPGTTYHFRIKATNSLGTTYGSDMTFTTLGQVPTATTLAACCLSATGAKLNGTVNANYLSTIVTFEYGTSTSYGNTVVATQSPVDGYNNTSVSANIVELSPGSIYHFRVKVENSLGTTYGDDMSFSTLLMDSDSNIYQFIKIGTQVWMKENLRSTKYNDGTNIPNVADPNVWSALTSGAYCWYENNAANRNIYGALYNREVVSTGKLCPSGWHVPSDIEWTTLTEYLGGIYVAGGKMKETGTAHWIDPNTGATNESGFTALPGGYRSDDGSFISLGADGHWWSSTDAWYRYIWSSSAHINRDYSFKPFGFSVRCIKDN